VGTVRDAAEREIADDAVETVEVLRQQRRILLAPDHERRHLHHEAREIRGGIPRRLPGAGGPKRAAR
jgi:hypothetical protein